MSTTELATQPKQALTIRQRLNGPEFAAEIARVLPKHLTPERMVRVAITALTRTPKLANCDQASFFRCMLDLSQWGLEPDGRRAHLIPFDNKKKKITECQLILDFKGIAELCYRSGSVSAIHADVVRRGDLFKFSCGYITEHTPWFLRDPSDRPKEAGEIYAVYCVVQMTGGNAKHEVMSVDDVNAIRDKSQGYYAYKQGWASSSPWVDYWNEMAKKTVFKRCAKWLPWSAEIHSAMERDEPAIDVPSRPVIADQSSNVGLLEQLTTQLEEVEQQDSVEPADPNADAMLPWEARIAEAEQDAALDKIAAALSESDLSGSQKDVLILAIAKRRRAISKSK